jgi:hypothetical protein
MSKGLLARIVLNSAFQIINCVDRFLENGVQNYVLLSPKKDYRKGDIGVTQETRKN